MLGVASSSLIVSKYLDQSTSFTIIPLSFKQVDISINNACGVTKDDDIWCTDNAQNTSPYKWFKNRGKLKHVSIDNGILYGVDSDDYIFYASNFRNPSWI